MVEAGVAVLVVVVVLIADSACRIRFISEWRQIDRSVQSILAMILASLMQTLVVRDTMRTAELI